jgi:hypothetical protein
MGLATCRTDWSDYPDDDVTMAAHDMFTRAKRQDDARQDLQLSAHSYVRAMETKAREKSREALPQPFELFLASPNMCGAAESDSVAL